MAKPVDLLVIGGGVIGLSVARQAALEGLSVRLLERGRPGGEASAASAGMLAAQLEAHRPAPLLTPALRSRELYPAFLEALREESGIDVDLRTDGALVVARGAAAADELERAYRFQSDQGLAVELLDGAALRRLEPSLTGTAILGLHLPDEWSLDPARLVLALVAGAGRAGVEIRTGVEAARLVVDGPRIAGAATADGALHAAGAVVVAAGAWAGTLAGPGITPPPSEPVRGQILCLRAPGLLRHVLHGGTCYLVPRGDGRVLAGSTMEHAGFDRRVTAEAVANLSAAALALVPELGAAAFDGAWAGLRPGSGDGLPVIGAARTRGLYYASGHLRNGIVLAPLTARAVVPMILGKAAGAGEVDLQPFSPLRFESPAAGA